MTANYEIFQNPKKMYIRLLHHMISYVNDKPLIIFIFIHHNGRNTMWSTRISWRWQNRATSCITANVLQTSNVNAECDKRAIELRWQRFESKVANFQLPQLHLTYQICDSLRSGWPRLSFADILAIRKLESLCYRVALFAWSDVSVKHRLVADRQTHNDGIYVSR